MRIMPAARGCMGTILTLLLAGCIGPPLDLGPSTLENAIQGATYSAQLQVADGQPTRWDIVSGALPAGLTLDPRSGLVSGSPGESGTFAFVVRAAAAGPAQRVGEASFQLTVIPLLSLSTALNPARVAESYDETLGISGGVTPYVVTIRGLPGGMTYDATTGRISGTPRFDNDDQRLEVEVADSGTPQQFLSQVLSLVIKPQAVAIATDSLPAATVGSTYVATLIAENGRLPYWWAVTDGVLPDDLRLTQSNGVIAGTVTTDASTQTFTITVTDADSPASADTVTLKLVVPVSIVTLTLPAGTAGGAYQAALGAIAGLEPYQWEISEGVLQNGLTLDTATGVLSGALEDDAQTQTFTVRVTDSDAPATTAQQAFTLIVN